MAGNKEEHDIVLPFGGDPIRVRFAINFLPITTNVDDQNDAFDPAIVRTSIYLNRI